MVVSWGLNSVISDSLAASPPCLPPRAPISRTNHPRESPQHPCQVRTPSESIRAALPGSQSTCTLAAHAAGTPSSFPTEVNCLSRPQQGNFSLQWRSSSQIAFLSHTAVSGMCWSCQAFIWIPVCVHAQAHVHVRVCTRMSCVMCACGVQHVCTRSMRGVCTCAVCVHVCMGDACLCACACDQCGAWARVCRVCVHVCACMHGHVCFACGCGLWAPACVCVCNCGMCACAAGPELGVSTRQLKAVEL